MEEGPNKGNMIDNDNITFATQSYDSLIQLAQDLGVDGIDFDYEEFWHADYFAV